MKEMKPACGAPKYIPRRSSVSLSTLKRCSANGILTTRWNGFMNTNPNWVYAEALSVCLQVVRQKKQPLYGDCLNFSWSHQGLNLGPSDYESDALTN